MYLREIGKSLLKTEEEQELARRILEGDFKAKQKINESKLDSSFNCKKTYK